LFGAETLRVSNGFAVTVIPVEDVRPDEANATHGDGLVIGIELPLGSVIDVTVIVTGPVKPPMPAARTCVDVEGPPEYTLRLSGDAASVKPAVWTFASTEQLVSLPLASVPTIEMMSSSGGVPVAAETCIVSVSVPVDGSIYGLCRIAVIPVGACTARFTFPENVPSGCRVIVVVWAVLPVGTVRLSGLAESMKLA